MAHATRSRHRWTRIAGWALAVLAAIIAAALIFVGVRAEPFARERAQALAAEWSDKLGRPVRIGEVDVAPFSGVVEVSNVVIGAAEDGEPPALTVQRGRLDVGLLRTLLSAATHPLIESIVVEGLQLNVVRLPDGTLNWQRISERMAPEEREQPQDTEPDQRVRNTVVEVARLANAEVAFIDLTARSGAKAGAPSARISDVDGRIENAGYDRAMALALQAAVLADERNLDLKATTTGEGGDGRAMPELEALTLKLARTELAPLAPFLAALGGAGSTLEQGALSADVNATERGESTIAQGTIKLDGARFERGERFDGQLKFDLVTGEDADRIDIKEAVLQASDIALRAQGSVSDLGGVPQLRDARVTSEGLSFDRIRALYPPFDRLTKPAKLRGPFAMTATGTGTADAQQVELEVSLTNASIVVPDRFDKQPGTPLVLRAELDAKRTQVDIASLVLQLADFRVTASGWIRELDTDAARFQLALRTPSPEAGSLLKLLPEVRKAIAARGEVPGTLAITGKAKGTTARYTASGELALKGLDIRSGAARFSGGGDASFSLTRQAERWSAKASADFTQLRAVYPGVIDKPNATELKLEMQLSGRPGEPATYSAKVPSFAVSLGRSDLRGSAQLANMIDPQIQLKARSKFFDPDDFVPGPADDASKKKPEKESSQSPLAKADGVISLQMKKGRVSGIDISDLDAQLRLTNGRAKAETLKVAAFGGELDGKGSELPLFGAAGPVRLRGTLESMAVNGLLARFAGAPDLLNGALGGRVDVTTAGASLDEIRRTLSGTLSGRVDDGEFLPDSGYAELADRLRGLADVPELERALSRVPTDEGWKLADMAGSLRFDDGAVLISEPITAQTPQGKLSLDGRVSLSDATALSGTWSVEPEAIEKLIGEQLELRKPIPLELQIEGPLTQPRFAFGDLEPIVEQVALAYGEQKLEEAAREGLDKALDETGIADQLPGKRDEERGAKQDRAKEAQEEIEEKAKDEVRREVEDLIPNLF